MRLLTYTVAPEQEGWPLRRLLRQILPLLDGRPQVTRWQRVA